MKECPKCKNQHDKSGVFCSKHCSNSRVFSEVWKSKRSADFKNSEKIKEANKKQREFFVKIKEEREKNKPVKNCPKCGNSHKKDGVFCSRKCSNSRIWTNEDKLIKSKVAKKSDKVQNAVRLLLAKRYIDNQCRYIKKVCPMCNEEFEGIDSWINKIYCSKKCYRKDSEHKFRKSSLGGIRHGAGRGKHGWYKGYWCDSSWELAWVIYNLEHNIKFERNTEGFEYEFEGKKHKYYPDFKLEDYSYIEVKGYMTEQNKAKNNQFNGKLNVLDKKEIKPYLEYTIGKYGNDFIKLYDGNPHLVRANKCLICGEPSIKMYCSRKCSGKAVAIKSRENTKIQGEIFMNEDNKKSTIA